MKMFTNKKGLNYVLSAAMVFACLCCYCQEVIVPLNSNLNYIYHDLNIEDRTQVQIAARTQSTSLKLPFKDDFYYAPTSAYPDPNKWSDKKVYVNSGFPISPPSIGVATFDGLNENGFPYFPTLTNNQISRPCDTLTSAAIDLNFTANNQTIQLADSLALSFYYQARGYGDPPEVIDSLVLDFFSPGKNKWIDRVWFAKGYINGNVTDTVFKRGFVKIDSSDYLKDGFKFRFRNTAAGTGNYDLWHLDYVYLDRTRSTKGDTVYKDIAFAYIPTPFLRDYTAMPAKQYRASENAPNINVKIRNNDGKAGPNINMTYRFKMDTLGQHVYAYDGGAGLLSPYVKNGYSNYAPHANPAVSYTFLPKPDSIDYKIKHYIFESGSPTDFIRENDTVTQFQRFRNYYALDDGGAEAGYYINASGAKIAIKINVNVPDSFLAVRIYFDPVTSVATLTNSAGFRINLWPSTFAGPGSTALYSDIIRQPIFYNVSPGRAFAEYKLQQPRLLDAGSYYVGIQQRADYMTIGFDRNTDHSVSTYYDAGIGWRQSSEKGSVMIRPVFGRTLPKPVGIDDLNQTTNNLFTIYPNPSSGLFVIQSEVAINCVYSILNCLGQEVMTGQLNTTTKTVDSGSLSDGMYLLVVKSDNQVLQQHKIIIRH
jgi:hypothetical protein